MLYRKIMLFHDLSVDTDGKEGEDVYASPMVVAIHQKINSYVLEYGYKPPRMIYEPVTLESTFATGIYTRPGQNVPTATAESLRDMISQIIEMEILFQKQLLFTQDKKEQFYQSNPVQQSLRQECLDLRLVISEREKEIEGLKNILSRQDNAQQHQDDAQLKVNKLEGEIAELKNERDALLRNQKEREAKVQELNRKYTMEKEMHSQLRQVY